MKTRSRLGGPHLPLNRTRGAAMGRQKQLYSLLDIKRETGLLSPSAHPLRDYGMKCHCSD